MLRRNDFLERLLRESEGDRVLESIGGYATHVVRSGGLEKATLLWFPAVGDPVASFAPALVALGRRLLGKATVVAVDPPGFGDSPPCADGEELGFPELYAWGARVLNQYASSEASIIVAGNSSGAAIAIGAAVRAAAKTVGAILVAWPDWRFGESPQADLLPTDSQELDRLLRRTWHVPPRLPEPIAARFLEQLRAPAYRRHVESFRPTEASALMQSYSGPLAFVGGRSDELVTPDVIEATARAFPKSELRWIDQCGHYPHREKKGELVELLAELTERFLQMRGISDES